jgi:hypothetical protein
MAQRLDDQSDESVIGQLAVYTHLDQQLEITRELLGNLRKMDKSKQIATIKEMQYPVHY